MIIKEIFISIFLVLLVDLQNFVGELDAKQHII